MSTKIAKETSLQETKTSILTENTNRAQLRLPIIAIQINTFRY